MKLVSATFSAELSFLTSEGSLSKDVVPER